MKRTSESLLIQLGKECLQLFKEKGRCIDRKNGHASLLERKSVATNKRLKRVRNNGINAHLRQQFPLFRIVAVIAPAIHKQPLCMQLLLIFLSFPYPLHRRSIQQRRTRNHAPNRPSLQCHLHILQPHALQPFLLRYLHIARLLVYPSLPSPYPTQQQEHRETSLLSKKHQTTVQVKRTIVYASRGICRLDAMHDSINVVILCDIQLRHRQLTLLMILSRLTDRHWVLHFDVEPQGFRHPIEHLAHSRYILFRSCILGWGWQWNGSVHHRKKRSKP